MYGTLNIIATMIFFLLFLHSQYYNKHTVPTKCKLTVSIESVLDTRYSILDSCEYRVSCIEYRVSSIEYRVSSNVYRVSSIEYREINYPRDVINRQGNSVFSTFSLSFVRVGKSLSLGRTSNEIYMVKRILSGAFEK